MTEPATKGKVWPLAVMALLMGLLTTFVVIRFTRNEPAEKQPVKFPPVAVTTALPPSSAGTTRPPSTMTATPPPATSSGQAQPITSGQPPDPADSARQAAARDVEAAAMLLNEARGAEAEGRLDKALDCVRKSRKLRDVPEAEQLEKRVAGILAGREIQKRKEQDALAVDLKARVEKLKDENRWDAALAAVEGLAPRLRDHSDYGSIRSNVIECRTAADSTYARCFAEARKARERKEYPVARTKAGQAIRIYPEREEARHFRDEMERELMSLNMVRVPPPPKGVAVKLGDPSHADEAPREYAGPGFLIDRFEVTNTEYAAFVAATGHRLPGSRHWLAGAVEAGAAQIPITGVALADAEAYAAWAGKRLPTEDEWEYTARYIDGRVFPWGDTWTAEDNVARCNSIEYGGTVRRFAGAAVGSFSNGASALDVMDLAGNVWEWTSTPAPAKTGESVMRVLKGGSFMTTKEACRAANRLVDDPLVGHHDAGFRCVRDLPK